MLKLCAFREWKELYHALQRNPHLVLPSILEHEKAQVAWLHLYRQYEFNPRKPPGYNQKASAREVTMNQLIDHIRLAN